MLPLILTEERGRNQVERAAFQLNDPFYVPLPEEVMPHPEDNIQAEPQDQSATAAPSNMTAERHVRSALAIKFNIHSSWTILHNSSANRTTCSTWITSGSWSRSTAR
eukprot:5780384-Amphidinium_carterae.1